MYPKQSWSHEMINLWYVYFLTFFPSFMIIHFVNISYVFHFFNQDTLDFTGYERMPWIRNEREKKN